MDNNYSDKKSRAGWKENNKDKKVEGIESRTRKICPDNFFCPDKRAFTTKKNFADIFSAGVDRGADIICFFSLPPAKGKDG